MLSRYDGNNGIILWVTKVYDLRIGIELRLHGEGECVDNGEILIKFIETYSSMIYECLIIYPLVPPNMNPLRVGVMQKKSRLGWLDTSKVFPFEMVYYFSLIISSRIVLIPATSSLSSVTFSFEEASTMLRFYTSMSIIFFSCSFWSITILLPDANSTSVANVDPCTTQQWSKNLFSFSIFNGTNYSCYSLSYFS
jgi:hypothetical protein